MSACHAELCPLWTGYGCEPECTTPVPVVEHVETTALETRDDGVHVVTTEATIIGPRSILRTPEEREP